MRSCLDLLKIYVECKCEFVVALNVNSDMFPVCPLVNIPHGHAVYSGMPPGLGPGARAAILSEAEAKERAAPEKKKVGMAAAREAAMSGARGDVMGTGAGWNFDPMLEHGTAAVPSLNHPLESHQVCCVAGGRSP